MYEAFYGLRLRPFALQPEPAFLFPSRRHQLALDLLEWGLMGETGFHLLTGHSGTGKTLLVLSLLQRAGAGLTLGVVQHTRNGFHDLMPWVLHAFGLDHRLDSQVERYQCLARFAYEQQRQGRLTVLVVDEAQHLSVEALEDLRMLSNLNLDGCGLQVILVGQPGLRENLSRPGLEALVQRLVTQAHLEALEAEECEAYIRHRLTLAGADLADIFTAPACRAIHAWSGGIPRLINLLADRSLTYGYADRQGVLTEGLVQAAARDMGWAELPPPGTEPAALAFPGESNQVRVLRPGLAVGLRVAS